uniref:Uncharacterized protein n=1 Tax=Cryptomonas curvata TaxID=233186 RepID=A0A7S0QKX2_9CRYP
MPAQPYTPPAAASDPAAAAAVGLTFASSPVAAAAGCGGERAETAAVAAGGREARTAGAPPCYTHVPCCPLGSVESEKRRAGWRAQGLVLFCLCGAQRRRRRHVTPGCRE